MLLGIGPSHRAFPCPTCGGETRVSETRANTSGLRRRRRCVDDACPGRTTTQEILVRGGDGDRYAAGVFVLVPRRLWTRLARLAKAFLDVTDAPEVDAVPVDAAAASPPGSHPSLDTTEGADA